MAQAADLVFPYLSSRWSLAVESFCVSSKRWTRRRHSTRSKVACWCLRFTINVTPAQALLCFGLQVEWPTL